MPRIDEPPTLIDFEQIPVQTDGRINDSGKIASFGVHRKSGSQRQRPHSSKMHRSRSRPRLDSSSRSSGAALERDAISSLATAEGLLDGEVFDPVMLEANFSLYTSSSSSSDRLSSISLEERRGVLRHLSPPRREPQMMTPQSLPELYIDIVRRGRNSRFCLQCNQNFEVGQLQLGYTVDTLFPNQPSRWVHVDCVSSARLRLRGGSVQVAMNPALPLSLREDLIIQLRRVCTDPGATEIRKWNYLAASVKQWDTYLLSEWEHDGFNGQSIAGDELPPKREWEVSTILASLPSYPLDSDVDEDNPCAVCHVAMRRGDMICRLPCHHMYHVGCIDTWLRVRTTCPLDNLCITDMLDKIAAEPASDDVIVLDS